LLTPHFIAPEAPSEDEWIDRFKTAFDAEEISEEAEKDGS